MSEPIPVAELLQRLQAGDERAAADLFARYGDRLSRLAEQHLSRKLAGRIEGEDVVQSVFRTFFRRSSAGEFRIDGSAQIWHLLVKITLLKARAKARFHTADKRDAGAERGGDDWLPQALTREPGPDEAAMLMDQIEVLLRGLPDLHAEVLRSRLEGHNVSDTADRLGVSRQTVHRVLNLLQKRLSDCSAQLGLDGTGVDTPSAQ